MRSKMAVFVAAFGLLRKNVRHGDDFPFDAGLFGRFKEVLSGVTAATAHADNDGIEFLRGLPAQDRGKIHGRRSGRCRD